MHTAGWMNYANKYVYSPKQAENNQQIDRQNRWTDSIDRQNDKPINYNTTKHSIKTENPQPHMQTFDKMKLNKMVMHVYTKTYYTKNDKFDIEQTFSTQFDAAHKLFKKLRFFVSIIVFKLDFPQKNCKSVTDSQALILKIGL